MQDKERVQIALHTLADSLAIPCDIITIHRQYAGPSRTKEFLSLRYGSLLLALAAFDAFLTTCSGFGERDGSRSIGLRPDRVRRIFEAETGIPNITGHWRARARVAPEKIGGRHHRSPWYLFQGSDLMRYLEDLNVARNILAHGGDLRLLQNTSGALHQVKDGYSIRLMTVEGVIQAVEDISSQTAIAMCASAVEIPTWPSPKSTKHADTGRISRPY